MSHKVCSLRLLSSPVLLCKLTITKDEQEAALGKQNVWAACPPPTKEAGIQFFFQLCLWLLTIVEPPKNDCPKCKDSKVSNGRISGHLTHCPWKFRQTMYFEASQAVFWSPSCYRELKLTTKSFTGCMLCGLLTQMQNISLQSLVMHRKQNLNFSPPLFFPFSCLIFLRLLSS